MDVTHLRVGAVWPWMLLLFLAALYPNVPKRHFAPAELWIYKPFFFFDNQNFADQA
jgi:hypothetical protein